MKKVLQTLVMTALTIPAFTFAATENPQATQTTTVDKVMAAQGNTTAQATVQNQTTTLVSPRTGIRYTLGNTGTRPIIFKTAAISAANSANVSRIVATNPALSAASQEKAKQALLGTSAQLAAN
ncbi:hypothetical protein [Acinetobacter ursingii]|uniref:hypothetical protein n=1 Tax=Acinetobacter ursingii TaxID=108980 RepID=UPI000CCB6356|nr:hypothetical protein [Acinetobacter ursingii]MEC8056565.1 hypothetical protein [Pseudomonadota bacterium]NOZ97591.1 hypothetical protein [Gammaproteobacteria bacterium]MCU4357351.1 hypothetical protein [Acinetobacter ursingii]MDI3237622.1 hypothetical protein [Acinetobacter ursingii]PMC97042.1 hypothetical protein CJ183_08875 [Acinetobacter ursingii]